MILSYHPCYTGDQNRICAGRTPDDTDAAAIRKAGAVILPQGCTSALFEMAAENCVHVFPDYTRRFRYPGKIGQVQLFRKYGAPHPVTMAFASMDDFYRCCGRENIDSLFGFPFVFKFSWSGEGHNVWLVTHAEEFNHLLGKAAVFEQSGQKGFLLQRFIKTGGRSLRVVVVGETCRSYWRVQPDPSRFGAQFSNGAQIDHHADKNLQERAKRAVMNFCTSTGINLAGFDILFQSGDADPAVLFLEINYYFGRRGLGGSEAFYKLLCGEIDKWLSRREMQQ
ncbi:MAG: ATP-grasp domain-containing protein [Thermodesulfobacteriota bacterium]